MASEANGPRVEHFASPIQYAAVWFGQAVDVYRLTGQTRAYRLMVDRQTAQSYVAHLAPAHFDELSTEPQAVAARSFVPVDSLRRVGRLIEALNSLAAYTVEIEAKHQTLLRYRNQQK